MSVLISIDLGTSKICALAFCVETQVPLATCAAANDAQVAGLPVGYDEQDPARIWDQVRGLLSQLLANDAVRTRQVSGISITGQMHGVLLTAPQFQPVTNLVTWRDQRVLPQAGRAGTLIAAQDAIADVGPQRTGCRLHAGYGGATLHHWAAGGEIPDGVIALSIADYVAGMLTGVQATDPTHAASWGLCDLEQGQWDLECVSRLGLSPGLLPQLRPTSRPLGTIRAEIARELGLSPQTVVYQPIGDNQASVVGVAGLGGDAAVVNLGTGGQVSIPQSRAVWVEGFETRPMPLDGFILVGASLCGGWSYAYLRRFFQDVVAQIAGVQLDESEVYRRMNELASQSQSAAGGLRADTRFHGTRNDPSCRGGLSGIDAVNLTPGNVARAFVEGMVGELAEMFQSVDNRAVRRIAASGNAVRANPLVLKTIELMFGRECSLSVHQEEAALGAARSAAIAADLIPRGKGPSRQHFGCIS